MAHPRDRDERRRRGRRARNLRAGHRRAALMKEARQLHCLPHVAERDQGSPNIHSLQTSARLTTGGRWRRWARYRACSRAARSSGRTRRRGCSISSRRASFPWASAPVRRARREPSAASGAGRKQTVGAHARGLPLIRRARLRDVRRLLVARVLPERITRACRRRRAAICRCVRGAGTPASSRADAGLPPARPVSGGCGVLGSSSAWHPRPSR